MRKCEPCGGPGPCLWDPKSGQYSCVRCHSEPEDDFFSTHRAMLRHGLVPGVPSVPKSDHRKDVERTLFEHIQGALCELRKVQETALRLPPSSSRIIHDEECTNSTDVELRCAGCHEVYRLRVERKRDMYAAALEDIAGGLEGLRCAGEYARDVLDGKTFPAGFEPSEPEQFSGPAHPDFYRKPTPVEDG